MTYLDRAIKDGYAIITGPENKQKIIYVTSDNHTENYNDPEEKVRAEFWAELIYEYDYPAHRIKVEVTIPDRVPTDRADIVIFSDDECKKPYAVVECKRDGVTDAEFLQAIEQGVGNATWVKLRASYVVIAVVSLPQCAFAHFGAGVKTSIIFVRKRKADEKPDENEAIFMAAPALIGYDATGRKTDSQLDEIIQKYEEFQKDATPFFA